LGRGENTHIPTDYNCPACENGGLIIIVTGTNRGAIKASTKKGHIKFMIYSKDMLAMT
jgi:hypothetical protein